MIKLSHMEKFHVYFNDFSDTFSDVIDQEYLIGNSANIDELSNIVKNTYKDKSKNNIILYGHKGYGRKCALERSLLDYELKNNTNLLKVRIDAFLHSSESNLLNAIQHQLSKLGKLKLTSITQLKIDVLDSYFSQFIDKFAGMCLVIDHIEILSSVKKQFFLYSILEWIKESKFPILFVGITTDLLFCERLEKRVKSRYQHIPLYFFQIDVKFTIQMLLQRVEYLQHSETKQIAQEFTKTINSKEFKSYISEKNHSYQNMIFIFRIAFGLINAHFELQKTDLEIMQIILKADNILHPNVKLEICKDLNQPEFMILFQFYSLIMQQKQQIYFNDILQTIASRKQTYSKQKQNIVGNFSPQVFNKSLDNLVKLNIIQLQNKFSKNLEQNQLILNIPLDDVKQLIHVVADTQPEFIQYIASY